MGDAHHDISPELLARVRASFAEHARLIEAHGRPGDVAIAISTSGNSENVLRGVAAARARGMRCIGLSGKGGGKLASRVEIAVVVPSDTTARIQEAHGTIVHVLCELVEKVLFPGPAAT